MENVIIYALVDPDTHLVRYVGQCHNLESRYEGHLSEALRGTKKPVYDWIRSLGLKRPVILILQTVPAIYVPRQKGNSISLPSVMEAKWLKRFRRTVLNLRKKQCSVYDEFVNSPELKSRYGLD